MKLTDKWWTAPAEGEGGKTVIVTGRDDMDEVMASGKFVYRIDVYWDYEPMADGMPSDEDARLMEQATESMQREFRKDRIAVMTGIYTGEGRRDWIFYCRNLKVFSGVFNRALAELPQMPLVIEAESDPEWNEYRNMRDMTYIPEGD